MKPRRWFRFSLRTLFILLTLFGVWLGVQVKWIRDRNQLIETNRLSTEAGGVAPWTIRLLGEPGYATIFVNANYGQSLDNEVQRLFPEAVVGTEFTGSNP